MKRRKSNLVASPIVLEGRSKTVRAAVVMEVGVLIVVYLLISGKRWARVFALAQVHRTGQIKNGRAETQWRLKNAVAAFSLDSRDYTIFSIGGSVCRLRAGFRLG